MATYMKAAIFKDIENMAIQEIPIPECPKNGILVKVYACGICGGDIRNYHNGLKSGIKNQIIGHEIAGQVVESNDFSRFKIGDKIAIAPDVSCGKCWYCRHGYVNLCEDHKLIGTHYPGGYAQFIALPSEILTHGFTEFIPDEMSYETAAFAETVAAVIACQRNINISLGDIVVIIGDGTVGCLHAEVARARGASKIIVVGMDKLTLVERFGPDYILKNDDMEYVVKKVKELTGGIGADVVISAVPTVKTQQQALEMTRKRGKVVIYGGVPNSGRITSIDSNLIHYGEITLIGSFSYPSTGLADALDAIKNGIISVNKYLGPKVSLDNITHGMDMVTRGEALKVMIDPWL